MTLAELIARAREELATAIAARQQAQDALMALRADPNLTEEAVTERATARDAADAEVARRQQHLERLETEQAREEEVAALAARTAPASQPPPAYDRVARVGAEERTYRKDQDPRGLNFLRDVARAFVLRDFMASDRLLTHMREEQVERGAYLTRATTTGSFDGLTVPQYLTDMFAPHAKAGRPLANVMRPHPLPPDGMKVYIGRGTTGTSTGLQTNQGDAVSENNYDDTLLEISVQTNSGQQTLSRQAVERAPGALDITMEDLFRSYGTTLDSTLITQATTGLSAVATAVAYTDASPTVAEAYPKFQQALSGVETALLDQVSPDSFISVLHSRRWRWLNQAMTSSWPLMQQPGIPTQNGGVNYGEVYGNGFRGLLPDGTPALVDNNIATNLGAGTNEDEIYTLSRDEAHLWEDEAAPYFIKAEEVKAANLQVLIVLYGYFAYTFGRYAHAHKIGGTGLVTPTWTGV